MELTLKLRLNLRSITLTETAQGIAWVAKLHAVDSGGEVYRSIDVEGEAPDDTTLGQLFAYAVSAADTELSVVAAKKVAEVAEEVAKLEAIK